MCENICLELCIMYAKHVFTKIILVNKLYLVLCFKIIKKLWREETIITILKTNKLRILRYKESKRFISLL